MHTRSTFVTKQSRAPALKRDIDTQGVEYVELSNTLRDGLGELLSYDGYLSGDVNIRLSRLSKTCHDLFSSGDERLLKDIASGDTGEGVTVFYNLPYEAVDWSPVPGFEASEAKGSSLSEHCLLAFAQYFGEPYGVRKEGHRLVNDLIASRQDMEKLTGNGSKLELGLHYENAALRFAITGYDLSPKALLLAGVSAQKFGGPETMVAISSRACCLVSDRAMRTLRSSSFYLALPIRQRNDQADANVIGPVPVVIGPFGREEIVAAFYGDMMRPANVEAEEALAELKEAVTAVAVGLKVVPGTMVALHNGRALHGRSEFTPVFDEYERTQRWVQRVFVGSRLDGFRLFNQSAERVFDIDFSKLDPAMLAYQNS
ncbi:hypothetical protein MAH1_21070 [Sessilibacter sp. MAH1]